MFFDSEYVQFEKSSNNIVFSSKEKTLPIVVMDEEHKSVKRVATDLQTDIEKVTGTKPELSGAIKNEPAIIVGTLNNTALLETLEIETDELNGKWESFSIQTVTLPNHTEESIVILGSDNRGTIYGVYDLTERIGVSPWYWWMDVPVKKHEILAIEKGKTTKGEPSVEYRGFFLNDEGPSLMTWVRTHFPDFTHEFYEKIFELTLRLKGNYHWPAMWDSTFYEDDEENIKTADLYGVVIGTSHHEPMDRPHGDWKTHKKGPWDYAKNESYLKEFWTEGIERSKPYETIVNLGMRGDGDEPMGGETTFEEKIKLMEKIIKDQRTIIQDTVDVSVDEVPQMWALYKEVKDYYDSGMEIPEDVTLLWGDDNFGNIRRLPTKEERNRKGGAGIYYHFDYVGGPRSYKWVNTVPIQKTYEQMHKAYAYDARKVWIVNVGDLKPMEYQTEFFLRLAWDVDAFNPENLETYALEWANYTFGENFGEDVAKVIRDYVKFNGRLKPEVINLVDLYSWENEYEAERVLKEFGETVELAEQVYENLPHSLKDAFYQVAYYPAKASYTVLKLQLLADLSFNYKKEGRLATNIVAAEARKLFEEDKNLTFNYNKRVSNGKWDHMMDQLHIGYTYWQQPDELIMPETATLDADKLQDGEWGISVLDSNKTDVYTKKPVLVDVYNKGEEAIELKVASNKEWLKVSFQERTLTVQERLKITVEWDKVEYGNTIEGVISITDKKGNEKILSIDIHNPEQLLEGGYVPVDGKIAIEAEDYTDKREDDSHKWNVIPDYGRTKSSVALYPVELQKEYTLNDAPRLSYDIVLPKETDVSIAVITAPSLNFDPDRDVRLGVSIDEGKPEIVDAGDLSQDGERDSPIWEESVIYNRHTFRSSVQTLSAGKHTVHLTMVDPQVVVQKIIMDYGGKKSSYLGPQPTPHADRLEEYTLALPDTPTSYHSIPGTVQKVDSEFDVYAMESGFYSFDSKIVSIDKDEVQTQTVYLEKGSHAVQLESASESVTIQLKKLVPLTVDPYFSVEEGDGVVRIVLHYTGDSSLDYQLSVQLESNKKVIKASSTKGIMKTDEQKLVTFVFDSEEIKEAENIRIKSLVDKWERVQNLSLN